MNREQRKAQAKDQRPSAPAPPATPPPDMESLFDEAVRRHQAGRLPDAEQLYRRVLAKEPGHSPALHLLGVIAHQVGNNRAAIELIGAAIRVDGAVADYHYNLGVCLKAQGRLQEALAAYDAAIRIRPDSAEAHSNRAVCLKDLGRLDEAVAAYDAVIRVRPDHAEARSNRGNVLRALGRLGEALAAYDAALRIRPDHPEAHYNRGVCLKELGCPGEALAAYDAALRIRPDLAEAHSNRGICLKDLGRPGEALAACDTAIRIRPDFAEARSNRGLCLKDLGRFDVALADFDAALRIKPDFAEAHSNRGMCLNGLGRFAEALAAADRAIALKPDLADAHNNRGIALSNLRRLEEALAAYDLAVSLNPESAGAHHNRALVRLRAGDLAAGFAEYRWRWKIGEAARCRPDVQCPEWEGEPLAGRRLLVFAEQGYGDSLQFVRYVPMAAARGAEVTLLVEPPLLQLFRASLPGVRVVDRLPEGAAFDLQAGMLCLPRLFGTTLETIPAATPYLVADPDRSAAWAARLRAPPGRKVGLVWAGAALRHDPDAMAVDARRSLRLAQLAPLASAKDVQFVSLQVGEPAAEARTPPAGMQIVDWTAEIGDFADTAALVSCLDLVVTVDTSVAHLAGSLGRPVWILSRYDGCWRWLKDRETSPWYPTARLFHQAAPGAWGPVIEAVVAALSAGG